MHTMLRVPDMVPVSNGSSSHAHSPYIYIFQAFAPHDMCIAYVFGMHTRILAKRGKNAFTYVQTMNVNNAEIFYNLKY